MSTLADIGPVKMEHFFRYFPSDAMAYKVVGGMCDRGEIKHWWYQKEGCGHPFRVMCNWNVEEDKRTHELLLTNVLLWYWPAAQIIRGYDVDQDLLPDAELTLGGVLHNLEMDCSNIRGRRIEDRLRVYEEVGDDVLWIVKTDERRKSLQGKTRNENAYFGLYGEIMDNPYGPVWQNPHGELASLS